MRIVLDTTILVRATENSYGLGRDLLLTVIANKHALLLSNEMLHEIAKVLRYPRLRKLYGFSEERTYDFIGFLREVAEIVPLSPLFTAPIRDVNDVIVIETALIGKADVLCTRDRDFYDPSILQFLNNAGITVLDDISLMQRLRV